MVKTFYYGVAATIVVVGAIGARSVWHMTTVHAEMQPSAPARSTFVAKSHYPDHAIHGLPVYGPVRTPIQPPVLTRDQLVTKGHADDKAEIAELFYTYIFYHDSHNGPGVASLFTKDGMLETLWNNGGKTIEPNAGPNGHGCLEYGYDQISEMFGTHAIPFPGHSHNDVTNVLIQVNGNTATLYANWTTIRSNRSDGAPVGAPPNTAVVSHNGEYISDLVRTPDGWRFVHHRAVEDEKVKFGIPVCERNVVGPQ